MVGIDKKSFDVPDEQLALGEKAGGEGVTVGSLDVKRVTFQPGWNWTDHVSSEPCETRHAGYVLSGRLHIVMTDGQETEIQAGEVVMVEPGHDAWTVGQEPCVFLDFGGAITQR